MANNSNLSLMTKKMSFSRMRDAAPELCDVLKSK